MQYGEVLHECVGISHAKGEGNTTQECNASTYCTPTGVMIDTSQHKTSSEKWHGKQQEASQLKAQTSYLHSCARFPAMGMQCPVSGKLADDQLTSLSTQCAPYLCVVATCTKLEVTNRHCPFSHALPDGVQYGECNTGG